MTLKRDLSSLTSPQKSLPLRCETKKRTDNGIYKGTNFFANMQSDKNRKNHH